MATKSSTPFSNTNMPKVGTRVGFTRRNGLYATGKVHGVDESGASGPWVAVNVGDKKKPLMIDVRPSQLSRV